MNQRILFLTPGLTKGGAETQLIKVATYLKSQNKEVVILALKPLNDFNLDGLNVIFLRDWKKKPLQNLAAIYRTFKNYKPDVVVAFMFAAILFARLLKLINRFTLISSIRTPVLASKWYTAFKITRALDDLVVYNSESSRAVFETNNLSKKNGIIINNAISIPNSFDGPIATSTTFIWCCVAHFRPAKDYQTLFRAISTIKDLDFRVDILGHLGTQKWPMEMIKHLKIEDKVRLLGFRKNVGEYLKNADAFVLSTNWEGSPNSVLEAMAFKKPVVASAVLGIDDLINDSQGGFLFKCKNELELAQRMIKVMTMGDGERATLGLNGRRFVEMHYAEEAVLKKWLAVIDPAEKKLQELAV